MDVILRDLCKAYGANRVLDRLNFSFPGGRISCVQGPSGCGKTTLLRLIAGLEAPDSGEVRGAEGKKISAVFQENRLLENLTVEKNILLTARPGFHRADAHKLLDDLGLADAAQRPTSALSGGMQRRVAVARALAADYELMLLDEPLTGLDGELRLRVLMRIQADLKGRTAIWITHDPYAAALLNAPVLRLDLLKN